MSSELAPPEVPAAEPGTVPLIGAALGVGLLAAVAALALFAWLGGQVVGGGLDLFDVRLRNSVRGLATPGLTDLMWVASVYGAPSRLAPVGLVAALLFLYRGWLRGSLLVVATLAGAGLLDVSLKLAFGRDRPAGFFDSYPAPESYSFPSGHALFATCFFGGLAVLATHRLGSLWIRLAVWIAALLAVGLIGVSRVYLGVHYPTDVAAGYAVGVVWVAAVALGDRVAEHRRGRRRR